MTNRQQLARELEDRAIAATSIAEAQALKARADWLRSDRAGYTGRWSFSLLFRN